MALYRLKHVDAFTSTPFKGNPAGVLVDARGLREDVMQMIASEMNLSETAFILPPSRKDADIRIRWFTPTEEVPLCGHATIAGFHALAEEGLAGMSSNGQHYFRLETRSGILRVKVEKNFKGISVEFDLPIPKFRKLKVPPADVLKALGIQRRDLIPGMPIVKDLYLYIPVQRLSMLRKIRPQFDDLGSLLRRKKLMGVCVFSLQTVDAASAVHSRFFAPSFGINEDPVTGSANGPLGVYLELFGSRQGRRIPVRDLPDGRREYVGEQGDIIGRPGRVRVRVERKNGGVERVSITGEAVTVCTATMTM